MAEYKTIDFDYWHDRYKPACDESGEIFYSGSISPDGEMDFAALLDKAKEFAKGAAYDIYHRHIWTRIDGDDGEIWIVNGIHSVNRIDYIVTERPWASRAYDESMMIDVKYC